VGAPDPGQCLYMDGLEDRGKKSDKGGKGTGTILVRRAGVREGGGGPRG